MEGPRKGPLQTHLMIGKLELRGSKSSTGLESSNLFSDEQRVTRPVIFDVQGLVCREFLYQMMTSQQFKDLDSETRVETIKIYINLVHNTAVSYRQLLEETPNLGGEFFELTEMLAEVTKEFFSGVVAEGYQTSFNKFIELDNKVMEVIVPFYATALLLLYKCGVKNHSVILAFLQAHCMSRGTSLNMHVDLELLMDLFDEDEESDLESFPEELQKSGWVYVLFRLAIKKLGPPEKSVKALLKFVPVLRP